jgi:hypothetical protein
MQMSIPLEAPGFMSITVKNAETIEAKLKDGWGKSMF